MVKLSYGAINKAVIDALGINADQLDGAHLTDIKQATREPFFPVVKAVDLADLGNGFGAQIDGAGDYGKILVYVPSDFTTLNYVSLLIIPLENTADMNIRIDTHYGKNGEGYNIHTDAIATLDIGACVLNQRKEVSIGAALDVSPVSAEDLIMIKVSYNATATDSNCLLLGAILKYA